MNTKQLYKIAYSFIRRNGYVESYYFKLTKKNRINAVLLSKIFPRQVRRDKKVRAYTLALETYYNTHYKGVDKLEAKAVSRQTNINKEQLIDKILELF